MFTEESALEVDIRYISLQELRGYQLLSQLSKNSQFHWKTYFCRNSLWKKLNSPVETLGNQWGKVVRKIRIAKF